MQKIFGKLNITWPKVIVSAIVIGVLVGLLNCVPFLLDTSFRDPAIYLDFWILCGIIIIMNSKSNMDSGLKCLVFFLISQPLIYLVEVPFVRIGWGILSYYQNWILPTILCFPMGYIGYYIKKNKWWGLLILLPMMILLAYGVNTYLSGLLYAFPKHLLSYIFSCSCLIIFPLYLFKNKKIQKIGLVIGIILIVIGSISSFIKRPVYETDIICSGGKYDFDDKYKVSLENNKLGEISIVKHTSKDADGNVDIFYCVHPKFVKEGKTQIYLVSPKGEKKTFDLVVKKNTYDIEERK